MEVEIAERLFRLDYRRAMFDVKDQTLILADLHVGKSAHFRKSGFSMPDYGFQNDLLRLVDLMEHYRPKKLLILGDLYHSVFNDEFGKWHAIMDRFADTQLVLILGNHDQSSLRYNPFSSKFLIHQEWVENGICYTHEPLNKEGAVNFCGHVHPGVKLSGRGKQTLKLPCFQVSEQQVLFPAFSELTGLAPITPKENDQVYVCLENQVLEVF